MQDETNGALLREIDGRDGWRSKLRACNLDKRDTATLIEFANKQGEAKP